MLPKFQKLFNEIKEEFLNDGPADGMSLEDIAAQHKVDIKDIESQFKIGLNVEKEHTDDPDIASEIVMDHLVEDPIYYTKLAAMEAGECDACIDAPKVDAEPDVAEKE